MLTEQKFQWQAGLFLMGKAFNPGTAQRSQGPAHRAPEAQAFFISFAGKLSLVLRSHYESLAGYLLGAPHLVRAMFYAKAMFREKDNICTFEIPASQ